MRKFKILFLTFLFTFINIYIGFAQNIPPILEYPSYGIYGQVGFNFHKANFPAPDFCPTCNPGFTNGSGLGPNFGILAEFPLSNKLFLDLRLGYLHRSGLLKTNEYKTVSLDGEAAPGIFEHSIDATLHSIALQPMIGINLFGGLNFELGVNVGYSVTSQYLQKEVLISPPGITYENDSVARLTRSGEIPNVNKLSFGIVGGLSYDIPLSSKHTWYLTPEAYYLYELMNVTKNQDWKISSLKLGLALKYQPRPEKPVVIPPPPVNLTASAKAYGVEYDGTEEEMLKIRVEEYQSSRWKPLLTYVFFDNNSATLPDRYTKITSDSAKRFKVQDLNDEGTLDVYHHLLNIIGKRMTENPDSKITLTGCNNGIGDEKNNKELSMRRAETIRDYLSDIWGINSGRINIETRNLPQLPSNSKEAEGVEENRRVEITSDNFKIVEPIKTDDTMRVANPPIARFKTESASTNGISHWSLSATQSGKTLKTFSGLGEPTATLDWTFENDEKTIPSKSTPLDYSISVTDNQGKSFNSPVKSIPIELISIEKKRRERIADKYVDRYSLIMFPFDKSDLSPFNEKIMDIIRSNLKPNSTANIIGHTDRTGEHEYNVNLSNDRANTVAKSMKFDNVKPTGVGEQELLYDNDLPEGRFYCRRVDVLVETPVE